MLNVNIKFFLYPLATISVVALIIFAYIYDIDLSKLKDCIKLIPKVVTFDTVIISIFVKWGWKLKLFRGWLVPFPNLNGSWEGKIYSNWESPVTGKRVASIPVILNIKQSFFQVSCIMMTGEMESSSCTANICIDANKQLKQIEYSYNSIPRSSLDKRSTPHKGLATLKIIEKPNKKLVGSYFTARLTKGEISLCYYSKELLEELPEDIGDHPVTEPENKR
jgi:hypothetical protein